MPTAARLLLPALLLLALPVAAQVPMQSQEYGCDVRAGSACRGRVELQSNAVFEFRVAGPGTVLIQNEGNRRCIARYSATDSRRSTTGQELNLTPGAVAEIEVPDAQGLILRFTGREDTSATCDLLLALRP